MEDSHKSNTSETAPQSGSTVQAAHISHIAQQVRQEPAKILSQFAVFFIADESVVSSQWLLTFKKIGNREKLKCWNVWKEGIFTYVVEIIQFYYLSYKIYLVLF